MEYKLIIPKRLDNLNDYIDECRGNKFGGGKCKKKNEDICRIAIYEQFGRLRITKKVWMDYHWYEKDRRRDKDNISSFGRKVIQDALVGTKVLKNDGWKEIEGFSDRFGVDAGNPRVEVIIKEIESR